MADDRQRTGYLLLADISGYTAFLTGSELEHAQDVVEDLMQVILKSLGAPFKLVKLEGDAAFFQAPGAAVSGERVLEAVEACYVAFHDRIRDVKQTTTCTCRACGSMSTLDLKFFVHHGDYLVQRLPGTSDDVAGSAVILVHRLLKNSVVEKTGITAYALFTEDCIRRLEVRPESLLPHRETYDHIGDVDCGVHDLRPVLSFMRENRVDLVVDGESDFTVAIDINAPPAVVWDYCIDPAKVNQWKKGLTVSNVPAKGRMGAGAVQHCAHGSSVTVFRFTDVRPFRHYTYWTGEGAGLMDVRCSHEFITLPSGVTRHVQRIRLLRRGILGNMSAAMFRLMFTAKAQADMDRLRDLVESRPMAQ